MEASSVLTGPRHRPPWHPLSICIIPRLVLCFCVSIPFTCLWQRKSHSLNPRNFERHSLDRIDCPLKHTGTLMFILFVVVIGVFYCLPVTMALSTTMALFASPSLPFLSILEASTIAQPYSEFPFKDWNYLEQSTQTRSLDYKYLLIMTDIFSFQQPAFQAFDRAFHHYQ